MKAKAKVVVKTSPKKVVVKATKKMGKGKMC